MRHIMLAALLLVSLITQVDAASQIGHSLFARGAATAQADGGQLRFLGPNTPLYEGDTLTTGNKSFAVIKLEDGTRMSLRPNTVFTLEQFKAEENSAVMRLFRGGFRALTGFISKRNSNGFKVNTGFTTIGIRGTTFDARICEDDCQQEVSQYSQRKVTRSAVVGRVAMMHGSLAIRGRHQRADQPPRQAVRGAPIYAGDQLTTSSRSFAVLAFRDRSRITLREDTEFAVESLNFNDQDPTANSALFRLVRGGIRALTGLIGKKNHHAYQVNTPFATIGIRGTGYDLVCLADCVDHGNENAAPAAGGPKQGLYAHVWDGEITVKPTAASPGMPSPLQVLAVNQTLLLPGANSLPDRLPAPPPAITQNPAPRPDQVDIDFDNLFGTIAQSDYPPGLFVNVIEGHVTLDTEDGQHIDLGADEAATVDQADKQLVRLELAPTVLLHDRYLKAVNDDFLEFYDLLKNVDDDGYQCTIQ